MSFERQEHHRYDEYLALDRLLQLQQPVTSQHDELLFVIVHQAHELWFKQLLAEFGELRRTLSAGRSGPALRALGRIIRIVDIVNEQVRLLESMTPDQFNAFRDELGSSGYFSAQYRAIEIILGRRSGYVVSRFPQGSNSRQRIDAALEEPTVWDAYLQYLHAHDYAVPAELLDRDPREPFKPSLEVQKIVRQVYLDDDVAAHVAERLVDLDQAFQQWRYRHAVLTHRIIGDKDGTAGSSGVEYLRRSVFIPAFPDLWDARNHM